MTHPSDKMTREQLEQTTSYKIMYRVLQVIFLGPIALVLILALFGFNKDEGDKRWRAEQTQKAEDIQQLMLRDIDKVYSK